MAWQVGVAFVAVGLAVDLEMGAGAPLLSPQRVLAERAVLGIEVFLPQRGRLDDMAVAVEHRKVFTCHSLLHTDVIARCACARRSNLDRTGSRLLRFARNDGLGSGNGRLRAQ